LYILDELAKPGLSLPQMMFCIVYAYAALGCLLFGGLVTLVRSNKHYQKLARMDYGLGGYWNINLNDLPSGMVLMVQLLVVNNWMVFAEAYGAVGGPMAWMFFITFYFIGVIAGTFLSALLTPPQSVRICLMSSFAAALAPLCTLETCDSRFIVTLLLQPVQGRWQTP
jgi:hypothetical protein